jgi:hypothetical protein
MPRDYNGWPSYETWLAYTWLTNDEGTFNVCLHLARVTRGPEQTATALKTYVEEGSPLREASGLYADLLNAAYTRVDWLELARGIRGHL